MLLILLSPIGYNVFQYYCGETTIVLVGCVSWPTHSSNTSSFGAKDGVDAEDRPCITICCEPGEIFVQQNDCKERFRCTKHNYTFDLNINMPYRRNETQKANLEKVFLYGKAICQYQYQTYHFLHGKLMKDERHLLPDGTIENIQKAAYYDVNQYCLHFIDKIGFYMPDLVDCVGYGRNFTTVVSPYLIFISACSLLLSFFIYAILPELCT